MASITINVYPSTVKEDDPLIVPEEPGTDDDSSSMYGAQSDRNDAERSRSVSQDSYKSVSFSSVVTVIKIAKWMAKSYGYESKKKSLYIPQEVIIKKSFDVI